MLVQTAFLMAMLRLVALTSKPVEGRSMLFFKFGSRLSFEEITHLKKPKSLSTTRL